MKNQEYTLYLSLTEILHTIAYLSGQAGRQDLYGVWESTKELAGQLKQFFAIWQQCKNWFGEQAENIEQMLLQALSELMDAQNAEDYIQAADICEGSIQGLLMEMVSALIQNGMDFPCEDIFEKNNKLLAARNQALANCLKSVQLKEEEIRISFALTGDPIVELYDGKCWRKTDSGISPWEKGLDFSEKYYDASVKQYMIIGLGMGYHVQAMLKKFPRMHLTVVEPDIRILKAAMSFQNCERLLRNPSVEILVDEELSKAAKWMKNHTMDKQNLLVHFPVLERIKNQALKQGLKEFFLATESVRRSAGDMNYNFHENCSICDAHIDEISRQLKGKSAYIIAAGPSLDRTMDVLKNLDRKSAVVIATGTVLGALQKQGVAVDVVVYSDPTADMEKQLADAQTESQPAVFVSTAYSETAKKYQGQKYVMLQEKFGPAEDFAKERMLPLFETGDTVTMTAMELAIKSGCPKLYFAGLDLAYPDGRGHAKHTMYGEQKLDIGGLFEVPCVNGGKVYTDTSFNRYRKKIEQKIAKHKEICFYNLSRIGAKIEGVKNI